MDIKEAERVVIAKPVASRPTCSTFRSFTELLAGAIDASPLNVSSETAVPAIRPKTVRFKPMVNHAVAGLVSSQAHISGAAHSHSSEQVSKSDSRSTVIYKPLAKVVSRATFSVLANMGNFNTSHQSTQSSVNVGVLHPNQDKCFRSQSANLHHNNPSCAETNQTTEPPKIASQNMEEDLKLIPSTANTDRPSYDGYNWRKYGQKQVKGSEYPRSYYKCTHPNCPVKKKVERSLDGQIAEIVYKGEHNHSKPQPPKRSSSGTQGLGVPSNGTGQDTNNRLLNSHINERNEGSEGRVEDQNEVGLPVQSYQTKAPLPYDPHATGGITAGGATPDNSCGLSGECEEASKRLEAEDYEPRSKRRKSENHSLEAGISGEGVQDPRVVVQNSVESDMTGDGFRWRKYGQKVVKGNPYPRSYYRCTSLKCSVRKHVERVSDDPKAFITTYEGKHNHDMPLRNTNAGASEKDTTTKEKP
ncbi:hypothetical protein ACFX15_031908 [Malus domestica]|uniref:WRKY transcription factor 44-like n=1 Tax=Malus sylvestris TaxID=3752 RepID=UPI0021ACE581|nr:WRKY transcription factor 44-like [Malus sylvestris]XP_050142981.1 WRKY transcription factor 44-like [Malus sylvestris]